MCMKIAHSSQKLISVCVNKTMHGLGAEYRQKPLWAFALIVVNQGLKKRDPHPATSSEPSHAYEPAEVCLFNYSLSAVEVNRNKKRSWIFPQWDTERDARWVGTSRVLKAEGTKLLMQPSSWPVRRIEVWLENLSVTWPEPLRATGGNVDSVKSSNRAQKNNSCQILRYGQSLHREGSKGMMNVLGASAPGTGIFTGDQQWTAELDQTVARETPISGGGNLAHRTRDARLCLHHSCLANLKRFLKAESRGSF